MNIINTPEFVSRFALRIDKLLFKIELVSVIVCLIGIALQHFILEAGILIITIVLVILAFIYFFRTYRYEGVKHIDLDRLNLFFNKLMNWSYSVAVISILFILNRWPGGIFTHEIAMISIVMTLAFILYGKTFRKITILSNSDLIRTCVIFIILASLIFSPPYKIMKETIKATHNQEVVK